MNAREHSGAGRIVRPIIAGAREVAGLLVDDGAVAVGVVVAVVVAAMLAALVGPGDAVGWVLFALVWVALALSLRRARLRG